MTTLPRKSWNLVRPFSPSGKVIENSQGHGKSWKMMKAGIFFLKKNAPEAAGSQEQLMKCVGQTVL